VCAHQGRSGGETDCARQAEPCGEPGRGVRDTDGDRVCDEPSDGRQGAVRGAWVRDFHIVQKLVVACCRCRSTWSKWDRRPRGGAWEATGSECVC
jgi:hypothetical protein